MKRKCEILTLDKLLSVEKMTNYWLCVTDEENWKRVQKLNVWGVRARFRKLIARAQVGDRLVFYVKPVQIGGIFEAVSNSYEDHKEIFSTRGFGGGEESFPYRIRLRKITIPENPLPFGQMMPKLKFIKNKRKWGGYLQGRAMIPISEYDYNIIEAVVKETL